MISCLVSFALKVFLQTLPSPHPFLKVPNILIFIYVPVLFCFPTLGNTIAALLASIPLTKTLYEDVIEARPSLRPFPLFSTVFPLIDCSSSLLCWLEEQRIHHRPPCHCCCPANSHHRVYGVIYVEK